MSIKEEPISHTNSKKRRFVMGLVKAIRKELKHKSHTKKWEKELLQKIASQYGKNTAKKVRQELKQTFREGTYRTYVLRINMVYQLLLEDVLLEDAIERSKKY